MPKICYEEKRFTRSSMEVIDSANEIIEEYTAEGFDLTLRQLYYQFVSRDLIPNTERDYKRLGDIISNARLAGLIDWNSITDRTRQPQKNSHWDNPRDILEAAAETYQIDKWGNQKVRVEVWVEKDALVGVIEEACKPLDVTFFSCRGYTSQSAMWRAAMRLRQHQLRPPHQLPVVLHLGDHDPSGIDMTRDIDDRLQMFARDAGIKVSRIALTMEQVEEHKPPPNPAKTTDARYRSYAETYGDSSWELDALDPRTLRDLIEEHVLHYRNLEKWEGMVHREFEERKILRDLADGLED